MSTRYNYIATFIALIAAQGLDAQCAMCKAVLESDGARQGAIAGRGVNDGILYLMGFPYLLMLAVVVYLFRDQLAKALGLGKETKA